MNITSPLKELMSKEFSVVSNELSIQNASKLFAKNNIQFLAVEKNEKFIGIVSNDVIKTLKENYINKTQDSKRYIIWSRNHSVEKILMKRLVALEPQSNIEDALSLQTSILFEHIILLENEHMVGFVRFDKLKRYDNCSIKKLQVA